MALTNFGAHEFECKCYKCGLGLKDMDEDFISRLELARVIAGVKFILTSAIRCEAHNRNVGGSETSAHLKGLAVDIKAEKSHERFKIIYGLIKAGFKRILIYKDFIHVDEDPSKPQEILTLL